MKAGSTRSRFTIIFISLFCSLLFTGAAQAQVNGAIFTTNSTGTAVNGNIYALKTDVYLNGGPQNMSDPGLVPTPALYYFMVTDPSGATLLSSDDISCRQVQVTNGRIVAVTGSCPHALGTFNSANGEQPVQLAPYNDTPNPGGEYKAWLTPVLNYDNCSNTNSNITFGFCNSDSKTDNFKVKCTGTACGGLAQPSIFGFKYYDTHATGTFDPSDPPIPGWRINALDPLNVLFFTFTDSTGEYIVPAEQSATFTISEVLPNSAWIATGCVPNQGTNPCSSNTSDTVTTGVNGSNVHGPDFLNVCVGAGGGLTLGFWSNKNGQALFTSYDLAYLVGQNLRDAKGGNFDPASYSTYRSWLLSATATNMAYMLSAQLSAMDLNVRHGFVSGGSLIYAPGSTSANGASFATVNSIIVEANTELGLHGLTLSGSQYRSYQEALKNALDKANNNLNFVQPGPSSCPFTTPY